MPVYLRKRIRKRTLEFRKRLSFAEKAKKEKNLKLHLAPGINGQVRRTISRFSLTTYMTAVYLYRKRHEKGREEERGVSGNQYMLLNVIGNRRERRSQQGEAEHTVFFFRGMTL